MKFELTAINMVCLDEFDKEQLGFKKDEDGEYIGTNNINFEPTIIEINTLEELFDFSNKHGKLVFDAKTNSIEIYNDFRE